MTDWATGAFTGVDPLSVAVLALVTLQRLGELVLAQRNTRALLAQGAVEIAPAHYPAIVAVHAAWLAGLWLLAPARPPGLALLVGYGLLQIARAWVLLTLGRRWTTRILVLPGEPLVRSGPYRFLAHPNYAVVAAEILVLPLAFGLVAYGVAFSALNAVVLRVRINAENAALRGARGPELAPR